MRTKKYFITFSVLLMAVVTMGQSCISLDGSGGTKTSGPAGFFLSIDKGETWKQLSAMPAVDGVKQLTSVSVYRLFTDPQDNKALYWASREQGLFYSFDEGRSWAHSVEPFNLGFLYSLSVHPKDKCTFVATNGRQVFKSDDCARSWTEIFREARASDAITSVAFDPFKTTHIYMSEDNGDLLKSEDMGKNWLVANRFGNKLQQISFDNNKEGLLYVATRDSGLFRTRDSGASWENLKDRFSGFPGSLEFRRLYLHPQKAEQIYWISEYGVITSRNAGEEWEAINLVTPPGSVDIYGFAINPKNDKEVYYTGTLDNRSTFYRSADGGKTWETRKLPSQQIPTVLYVHPEKDSWIYLGYTIPPKE
ncbi:MAG: hypothetical protein WCW16_01230 [Candidatus Magasanikbacteria bacterium]